MTLKEAIETVNGTDKCFIDEHDRMFKINDNKLHIWSEKYKWWYIYIYVDFDINLLTSDKFEIVKEKKSGWINIYPNREIGSFMYETKEEAIKKNSKGNRVDTAKIEWEE